MAYPSIAAVAAAATPAKDLPHHYLVPYVGTGQDVDPFQPMVEPGARWAGIDLRPSGRRRDGWAIVASEARMDAPGRVYLGDGPSRAARRLVSSRLATSLRASAIPALLAELLIRESREDGTRWRPLWPTAQGVYEIWLGGLVWRMPALAGGTSITESFNTADSTTLGPDLTWTETLDGLAIVSNAARGTVINQEAEARAEHDLASADHYAQVVLAGWATTAAAFIARINACCRFSASARTYYAATVLSISSADSIRLVRVEAGATTVIAGPTAEASTTGDVIRVSANGSTIKGFRNTVERLSVTDTVITGHLRSGFNILPRDALGNYQIDNFAGGALETVTPTGRPAYMSNAHSLLDVLQRRAYPVIAAVAASATPADSTSHVCTLPSGIAAGDLLLAVVTCDGDAAMTWPAGWTALTNGAGASGTAVRTEARYRLADGGEGASITITGSSEAWVSRVCRITGHHASAPECVAATGTSANADPAAFTPSWGQLDTLWLLHVGWDGRPGFTFWPNELRLDTRRDAHVSDSGGASGWVKQASVASVASHKRAIGALTSDSAAWRALTIAVRPAVAWDAHLAARQFQYGVEA
jgi:hypothetical protein